jgi:hypothetical protein
VLLLEMWGVVVSSDMGLVYSVLEQRDLSTPTYWRLNTPKCPNP